MLSWCCPLSGAELAGHEGAAQRQLGSGQRERFAGQGLGNAVDLVEHLAGGDFGNVVLRVALAVAHTDFGRLLGDRLVREDADEDAATTLDVTRDGTTCRLDLARGDAATLGGLEAEVAEGHGGATGGDAGVTALLLLAVLATCGLQHAYSPLPSPAAGALRTRATPGAPAPAPAGLSPAAPRGARSPGRPRPAGAPGRALRRGRRSSSAPAGVLIVGASPLARRSPR